MFFINLFIISPFKKDQNYITEKYIQYEYIISILILLFTLSYKKFFDFIKNK